ncbi:hypothetical protein JCM11491_002026 [Sporobolomyces phaffii]
MNAPLLPPARAHRPAAIDVSDNDVDDEYDRLGRAERKRKRSNGPVGNSSGNAKDVNGQQNGSGGRDGKRARFDEADWGYYDSDGDLVLDGDDSPAKPFRRSPARDEPRRDDFGPLSSSPGRGGGGPRAGGRATGAGLAFAGGSSKAAQHATDPLDDAVETVCAIIPDVVPTHVRDLLRMEANGPGNVELVVEALLTDSSYPKRVDDKPAGNHGSTSHAEEQDGEETGDEEEDVVQKEGKAWMDTKGRKSGDRDYEAAALMQLYSDFPTIQQNNIKRFFADHSNFYAPTYAAAQRAVHQTEAERGFKLMASGKSRASKGKGRASEELEREKSWVAENLARFQSAEVRAMELAKREEAEIAAGNFFECGCCFGDTPFSQIVICDDGCQFCKACALMNAETQIGMRKYILPCMSTSGCQATFPESEIVKFLPRKSRSALHKIRQEKEIDLAELDGLEKCPFCPFAYIIENDQERLFHCQRPECGVVTCRQCKKKDHLPKTCREVSDDAKIDAIHQVEEAMSSALIRKCPRCAEPYIKENDSCNKIYCGSCRTLSCYICNQVISGYEHFANAGKNAPNGSEAGAQCPLWDDTGLRNYAEIEAARQAAEKIARDHPGLSEEDLNRLKADAPPPPPARIAHLPPPVVPAFQAAGIAPPPRLPGAPYAPLLPAAMHRPHPPPIPRTAPLDPQRLYSWTQVKDMYRTAYEIYSIVPRYAPYLTEWAEDEAGVAYNRWLAANRRHRDEEQRRQKQKDDLEWQRVAAQRRQELKRKRQAEDDAREARRKRTQGK